VNILCDVLRHKSYVKRDKHQKKSGHHFAFSSPVNQVDLLSPISQISYLLVVQAKSAVCFPVYHRQNDKGNRHVNMAIQNNNHSYWYSHPTKTWEKKRTNPSNGDENFNLGFGHTCGVLMRRRHCKQTVQRHRCDRTRWHDVCYNGRNGPSRP